MYNRTERSTKANNHVVITGRIIRQPVADHTIGGETFYQTKVMVRRLSGAGDQVPVLISDRLYRHPETLEHAYVRVEGQFRSYDRTDPYGEDRLYLNLFAQDVRVLDEIPEQDVNEIEIIGTVREPAVYRTTPNGREVADLNLVVDRSYGKTDTLPCLVWSRNARYAGTLEKGTKVHATGRIQSRIYRKNISETEYRKYIAFEVSLSGIWLEMEPEPEKEMIF